ncbi:UvrD-helicase domain-containing protein [Ancylobacter lacus]|uniref:UvrD-helicase domain-containing protein n=1 Tax=Ancylobacter lacus TaxID=2579970 RepID=UPI001BCF1D81|nr:UvrD-helicase domain-containing protein [Ancylobacter lacus]
MLDETRIAFVEALEEDIRFLAPAGSGKTLSLLNRCAHLHRRRAGTARFLIVSFTRAAREEVRSRLTDPAFAGAAGNPSSRSRCHSSTPPAPSSSQPAASPWKTRNTVPGSTSGGRWRLAFSRKGLRASRTFLSTSFRTSTRWIWR